MLSDHDLELFKICELPYDAAVEWIKTCLPPDTDYEQVLSKHPCISTAQTCDLGGDTNELIIYRHTNGFYYLVQALLEETTV